jgi:chromosome segregation ATPase
MSEIRRFAFDHELLIPDPEGSWVQYVDYEALQAQLAQAREEVRRQSARVTFNDHLISQVESLKSELAQCQQQLATDALQFASRIVALKQDLARLRQELEHWKASYEGKSLDEKEFLRLKQENATLRQRVGELEEDLLVWQASAYEQLFPKGSDMGKTPEGDPGRMVTESAKE